MVDIMKKTGNQKMIMISEAQRKLDNIETRKILYDIIVILIARYKAKPSEFLETRLRELKATYESFK